jgi:hypothetical protein
VSDIQTVRRVAEHFALRNPSVPRDARKIAHSGKRKHENGKNRPDQAWERYSGGNTRRCPVEITRECPLRCPGCYAYEPDHLKGSGQTLRTVSDYKGQQLIERMLAWSTCTSHFIFRLSGRTTCSLFANLMSCCRSSANGYRRTARHKCRSGNSKGVAFDRSVVPSCFHRRATAGT